MAKLLKSKQKPFKAPLLAILKKVGGKLEHLEEAILLAAGEGKGSEADEFGADSYSREQQLGLIENGDEIKGFVIEALSRINDGAFGSCLACENLIPLKRLEVLPYAQYCVPCQELDEKGELQLNES